MEWLEAYINRFKGTVLTISHDRYFLDQVADRIVEIHEGHGELFTRKLLVLHGGKSRPGSICR